VGDKNDWLITEQYLFFLTKYANAYFIGGYILGIFYAFTFFIDDLVTEVESTYERDGFELSVTDIPKNTIESTKGKKSKKNKKKLDNKESIGTNGTI